MKRLINLMAGVLLCQGLAGAVPLTNATGIVAPGNTLTFSELNPTLTVAQPISAEFTGLGLSLSGPWFFSSADAPGDLDGLNGFSGDYLFVGPTSSSLPVGPVLVHTLQFAGAVTAASVNLVFVAPKPAESTSVTVASFLGATPVETFTVNDPDLLNFSTNFFGFTSSLFDRIVLTTDYSGAPTSRPGLAMDNVSWTAAAGSVPELEGEGADQALAVVVVVLLLLA